MTDHSIILIQIIKIFFGRLFHVILYSYSFHLFLISSASTRSLPFLSFIVPIFGRNVPLVFPIFLKKSLVSPLLLFSSSFMHCSLKKDFLSPLAVLWNSGSRSSSVPHGQELGGTSPTRVLSETSPTQGAGWDIPHSGSEWDVPYSGASLALGSPWEPEPPGLLCSRPLASLFWFWPCYPPALWPWAGYVPSRSSSFLIYKRWIIILTLKGCCESSMR